MDKDWLLLFSLPGFATVFYYSYTLLIIPTHHDLGVSAEFLLLFGAIVGTCGRPVVVSQNNRYVFRFFSVPVWDQPFICL